MTHRTQPIKVSLICSGLGHIQRGYESFTQECFDALAKDTSLKVTLFKGGGTSDNNSIPLWNLPRNAWTAKILASSLRLSSPLFEPYFIEQASFCLSFIPYLYQDKPNVVFFSDFALGTMLWHWRRISKLSYKLLFSNGAPNGPPFSRMDHVQHLTPVHYQAALDAGEPASKHSLVPYGIQIDREYSPLSQHDQDALRRHLNLPLKRPILLSVGALNKIHKRMDYVIREVANLPEPRPYLLLLGQMDGESAEVIELANQLLGIANFQINTVPQAEVKNYYQVANAFVLASLSEGLPRVTLEAMAYGLPCLAHNYEVTRFVLGDEMFLDNFEVEGRLAGLISQALLEGQNPINRRERHCTTYHRFSWDALQQDYVKMIQHCASFREEAKPPPAIQFS